MSSVAKRNRKPEPYRNGKSTPPQPGDEMVGEYTRERLIRMDEKFCARMERAIARGLEQRPDSERVRAA
jgi:hypothetical protein